jgi:hypothetical protein
VQGWLDLADLARRQLAPLKTALGDQAVDHAGVVEVLPPAVEV